MRSLMFVLLCCFLAPTFASAKPMPFFEAKISTWHRYARISFAINKLDRVFAVIATTSRASCFRPSGRVERRRCLGKNTSFKVLVPGISLNKRTKEVIYTDGDRSVLCGKIKKILFKRYVKITKNCSFSSRFEDTEYDDGIDIHKKRIVVVSFNVKN